MKKSDYPTEITTIEQIQQLTQHGFDNWLAYGEVNVMQRGDLLLFDYTTGAHKANRWNFFERVCRGLIINKATGEIVARPFDKFFYWLEGGRRSREHISSITEKVDGSLGILYRHKGDYLITTKGSFFSPQARWATKFLQANFDLTGLPDQLTLLFEIIYPDNRIIVDYDGREDLVLLAARHRETGDYISYFPDLYELGERYGFTLPQVYTFNSVDEIIANTGVLDANMEGWVAEFSDGQRFKFKVDEYVEIHRLLRELGYEGIVKQLKNGSIDRILEIVPDAFLDEPMQWIDEIQIAVADIKAQVEAIYATAPQDNFQSWAESEHPRFAPYLLARQSGDNLDKLIIEWEFQKAKTLEEKL